MKRIICFCVSIILIFSISTSVSATDKILVKENENVQVAIPVTNSTEDTHNESLPVEIRAKSAILMEATSGKVLLEYNPDKKLFPASVTKIMTMLLVAEAINSKKITLADEVPCSANAASKGGSQIWLKEGECMSVDELLRATAIGSANDAATLLGEYVAGSETAFIDMMNTRAKELKMNNTHFENATGLDDATDTHLTTARDIGIMSCELLKYNFIRKYTTVWMDSLRDGKTELVNTNKLVRFYSGTTGLKTGTTSKAGCCVSASAMRDGLHLVAVVMGSDNSSDRFETAKAMLNWGFSNYTCVAPKLNKKSLRKARVVGGKEDYVLLTVPEILPIVVKKGDEEKITTEIDLEESYLAPIAEKESLGIIKLLQRGEVVAEYKITAKIAVEELGFWGYVKKISNFVANGKKEYPEKADNP